MLRTDKTTRQLHFRQWEVPPGVARSALFDEPLGCGVYVIIFADDEEYVGKSVNFSARFASHRRRWDDIVAVRFAEVTPAELAEVERSMIRERVNSGALLRNLQLLAQPLGSSTLDAVIDKEFQAEWLHATVDDTDIVIGEDRAQLARRRFRSRALFDELHSHPRYDEVLTAVARYVAEVIPWPDATEGRLWILTALPGTARRRDNRRLVTLSIQNVEVLYLGEERELSGEWIGYTRMNTALIEGMDRHIRHLTRVTQGYRSTGPLQAFKVGGFDALPALLAHPEVRTAARSLALGLLRRGRAAFHKYHNDAFTDAVFIRIDELMTPA